VRRLRRDPLRFDTFDLLTRYGQETRLPLRATETIKDFAERVRAEAEKAAATPTLVYGQRAQALFEGVVAGIGKCVLLKQEDASGEVYYGGEGEVAVPDFRVVLADGRQLLIEVKNFHQGSDARKKHTLKASYVDSLAWYAKLVGCELLLATYWVGWRRWTLVSPEKYEREGDECAIELPKAIAYNRLGELGDYLIGTRFPLRVRLVANPEKPSQLEDGAARFTILRREVYSGAELVEDPVEQRIAMFLVAFSDWGFDGPVPFTDGDRLLGVEYSAAPTHGGEQITIAPDCDFVATLSGVATALHRAQTEDEEGIMGVRVPFVPGAIGSLIPDGYKGKALPLWIFHIQPATGDVEVVDDP
jgi:hypothetical protein